MSLYRKYRPLDFDSLLGQDHIREILQNAVKLNRVSHAYLFTGPRGTGKTSTARILARAINCPNVKESNPCNKCEICASALEERLTDLIEIDAASHGLVDDARALVEQAKFMPVQAKKKIYIIDEVHMLSKSAFNALLKIIEEPPDHVHFILATTEAHKVPDTIKSRCQRFDFHLADDHLIAAHISQICQWEGVSPEENAIDIIASYGKGSFRDALSLLEQVISLGDFTLDHVRNVLGLSEHAAVSNFVQFLEQGKWKEALKIIHDIHEQGNDLYQFCQSVLEKLRTLLLSCDSDAKRSMLLSWVDHFFLALDQLRDPILPELPLEIAVMKSIGEHAISNQQTSKPADQQTSKPATSNQKPETSPSFDLSKFLSAIEQSSLRRTLKGSRLELNANQLSIATNSETALSQIKKREHFDHLLEIVEKQLGKDIFISISVAQKQESLKADQVKKIFL